MGWCLPVVITTGKMSHFNVPLHVSLMSHRHCLIKIYHSEGFFGMLFMKLVRISPALGLNAVQ